MEGGMRDKTDYGFDYRISNAYILSSLCMDKSFQLLEDWNLKQQF